MTPTQIRSDVVAERIAWIREMTASIKKLPLLDYEEFSSDTATAWFTFIMK